MPFGTQYRSGRGLGAGSFSPPRTNQGIPMQPVPMSGQTGDPQTAKWSVADAIMAQTYDDEIHKDDWSNELRDDDDDVDDDIADWDEWNTPRYDVERFHQSEGDGGPLRFDDRARPQLFLPDDDDLDAVGVALGSVAGLRRGHVVGEINPEKYHMRACESKLRRAEAYQKRYLKYVQNLSEMRLRAFIRQTLKEINAISAGGATSDATGNIRGVVTPLGTGPKHPRKVDKRGVKKRNKKRNERNAESFGGGSFADHDD